MNDNFKGALLWPDPALLVFPTPPGNNTLLTENNLPLLAEDDQPLEIE